MHHVPYERPYIGPAIYQKGDYNYLCKIDGEFIWYMDMRKIFIWIRKYIHAIFICM
ncbi:DUF5680 domain-containing protein [[Clostridium] fimetarium]|uniref:DUF5680 domain-containing protein n=1 Tax=[Clostridium] fimetarium TaxID=99656 RepID=UPI0038CD6B2E